jgi:redox-sensitive bicupin YhaK (pirin superfamily)
MSAGTGILHSEINYSAKTDVHFVQMWVLPDTKSIKPGYQETHISDLLDSGQLFPIASGRGHDGAVSIQQQAAVLWGARLKPGASVALPDAPYVHLYVARGPVDLEGAGRLAQGDAARMIAADGRSVTAPLDGAGAEILAWEFRP